MRPLAKNTKRTSIRQAGRSSAGLNCFTVFCKILTPTAEGMACTINSQELADITVKQERLPCSHIVKHPTYQHHLVKLFIGQTFIKHGKIIAEIEEGLHGIALRERSSSHMIDVTLWQAIYLSSANTQSPTEVDFLIMRKETTVKSAHSPIVGRTNHHSSTCCPMYFLPEIILSVILFYRLEHTSATEGITITVDETSACSSILKSVAVIDGKELRLTGCHFRMYIHKLDKGCQPMMGHLNIRVEQQIILCVYLFQRFIVAFSKSPVFIKRNGSARWKLAGKHSERLVCRGIICHIDYSFILGVL